MRKDEKILGMFKPDVSKKVAATKQGNAGYDNPRENIDPHIKTKVLDAGEIVLGGTRRTTWPTGGTISVRESDGSPSVTSVDTIVVSGGTLVDLGSGAISIQTGGGGAVDSVFGRTGAITSLVNDYTWGEIDKSTSNISDITTKSHTVLSDIGTTAHTVIDGHISDDAIKTFLNVKAVTVGGDVTGTVDSIQIDHVNIANIGTNTHATIDSHISDTTDPHGTILTQASLVAITVLVTNAISATSVDHLTGTLDMLTNICYDSMTAPTASTTAEGTLFIKYTA